MQTVPLLVHGIYAFLGAHRLSHCHFVLCFAIVHDEGLFSNGHILVSVVRLTTYIFMASLRPRFHILTESWVQVFDARSFLGTVKIFVWVVPDRRFELELFGVALIVVLALSRRKERVRLVMVRLGWLNVSPVSCEFLRLRSKPLSLAQLRFSG